MSDFESCRRTGRLSNEERRALVLFLEQLPRPLSAERAITNASKVDDHDFALGAFRLQARGWVRVRRLAWELTPRCYAELPWVAGEDVFTKLFATRSSMLVVRH